MNIQKPIVIYTRNAWSFLLASLIVFSFALEISAGGPTSLDLSTVKVPIFKSRNITMDMAVARVSVGSEAIADILILKTNELYIVGKKLGTTNVLVWDAEDNLVDVIDIEVTHDLNSLRHRLHTYLPEESIGAESSQGQLVLSGQSSSLAKMDTAVELARGYAEAAATKGSHSKILNMISIGGAQQVMLEVTVAEVTTELARSLDAGSLLAFDGTNGNAGIVNGADFFSSVVTNGVADFTSSLPVNNGLFGTYLSGNALFQIALNVARTQGIAKVLAEPTLTTLSGQKAEFLSGGEFPVPVPSREGTTIVFRDFGVGVSFVPTVLDSGSINLNLKVLVSELSNANAVGITPVGSSATLIIPSIVKRTTETTVELADGQTIAISGLLSDNLRESFNKIPGLGDVPILGQLFRSQEFIQGQTELVIMVTPRLVRPFNKEGIALPTDGFVPASDQDFYLLGKMTSLTNNKSGSSPNASDEPAYSSDGGTEQRYGHELRETN